MDAEWGGKENVHVGLLNSEFEGVKLGVNISVGSGIDRLRKLHARLSDTVYKISEEALAMKAFSNFQRNILIRFAKFVLLKLAP